MAELEIHHESDHELDPMGQKVGILAAVLAVGLAVVTIVSHRAHTEGVLLKTSANDQWSLYQAKRIKLHTLELGEDLLTVVGSGSVSSSVSSAKILDRYRQEKQRNNSDAKKAQQSAEDKERDAARVEGQALRFDIGEGLLEIALVLSSLYFISRKMLFPVIGVTAGLLGIAVAVTGLFL